MTKPTRKLSKLDKAIIIVGTLVIAAVISFLFLYFRKSPVANTHRGSLSTPAPVLSVPSSQMASGNPVSLSISSINSSLNIIKGQQYPNGTWTLTPDKVQYAIISPEPNNKEGNTVIYGHATKAIFGHLYLMKKGDIASIITDNGYVFRYRFEGSYSVSPFDFSIFSYKGAPILTLQTCSGTFYQNRQMYQFSYVSVEKA
jgi:LPXTG-site transpeptidase (sortase) family protein